MERSLPVEGRFQEEEAAAVREVGQVQKGGRGSVLYGTHNQIQNSDGP